MYPLRDLWLTYFFSISMEMLTMFPKGWKAFFRISSVTEYPKT